MTTPKTKGAPIRDCPDCEQEIHAPAATAGKAFAGHRLIQLICNHAEKTDAVLCECGWQQNFISCGAAFDGWLFHYRLSAPTEPSDSAAVREALSLEAEHLEMAVCVKFNKLAAQEIIAFLREHWKVRRAAVASTPAQAAPAPTPAPPIGDTSPIEPFGPLTECEHQTPWYSCSVCNKKKGPWPAPAEPVVPEREPTMRREPYPGEIETPLFNAIWCVVKHWEIEKNGSRWSATGNDVCGIIDSINAAAPRAAGTRKVLNNFVERELIDVDTADKLEKALEPRAAGGQRELVTTFRKLLCEECRDNFPYSDEREIAHALTVPYRGKYNRPCKSWYEAKILKNALIAAEPQVEGGGENV